MSDIFRYEFQPHLDSIEIESAILLSILATEDLHGETQTLLEVAHYLDAESLTCVVDASTEAGRDFNRLFAGLIRREFGEESFQVERLDSVSTSTL